MGYIHYFFGLVSFLIGCNLAASEDMRVIGLFKNAAMIDYAGKQKIYRSGQNISPTIKLLKANTKFATFLVNGKKYELGLQKAGSFSANVSEQPTSKASPQSEKVATIYKNNSGMYRTPGYINGALVSFLVDTGASQVAMNESMAKRIGLLYKSSGKRVGVSTAAGVVSAWETKLKKVKVGGIELGNVDALIIKGVGPGEVLLGMSFLSKVDMQHTGQSMKLTQKY